MATKKEVEDQDDWPVVDAYFFKFALSCQLSEDGQSTKLQVSFNLDFNSFPYTSQKEALECFEAEEHFSEVFRQSNIGFLPLKPPNLDEKRVSFQGGGDTHLLLETESLAKPAASSAAENETTPKTTPSKLKGKKQLVIVRVNYKNFEPEKRSPSVLEVWENIAANEGKKLIPAFLLAVLFFLGRAKNRFMS